MGNVILPFDHMIPCRTLADMYDLSADEIYRRIFKSGIEWEFEEGKIGGDEFYRKCTEAIGIRIKFEEFKRICTDIFTENSDVSEIIRELKPRAELILLSNTNEWHFHHCHDTFKIITEFDKYILSHEVGCLKPNPRIFEITKRIALNKDSIIYIDDTPEYIKVARQLGIHALKFTNADGLREKLKILDCI